MGHTGDVGMKRMKWVVAQGYFELDGWCVTNGDEQHWFETKKVAEMCAELMNKRDGFTEDERTK